HISAVSKVYVLGDMGELGVTAAEAHYRVCVLAAASDARAVYVFGPEFCRAVRKVSWGRKRVYAFALEELSALQETLDAQLRRGDFVLVKGSRSVALERLEPLLRKER
ncbi:UDP-N-acetylmuramoyl-tripeptide--D-alanyl-D-alanine ligase, partial [Treponema pallidum]